MESGRLRLKGAGADIFLSRGHMAGRFIFALCAFLAVTAASPAWQVRAEDAATAAAPAAEAPVQAKDQASAQDQAKPAEAPGTSETKTPEEGVIGTIVELEGTATVTPDGGEAEPAAIDQHVHLNDTVNTGKESRVFIAFIDDTKMTLSENTKMTIDDYVFDPDNNKDNKARYSVLEGAFQYVSGLIGHKDNPDVKVETPVGSIGIRGTDFWGGKLDGEYNVAVNEGQVGVANKKGESVINKGEGTSISDRFHAPKPAHAWGQDRFDRIGKTVFLRRGDFVRKHLEEVRARHGEMRGRFRDYMHAHRAGGRWQGMRQLHRQQWRERMRQRRFERLHGGKGLGKGLGRGAGKGFGEGKGLGGRGLGGKGLGGKGLGGKGLGGKGLGGKGLGGKGAGGGGGFGNFLKNMGGGGGGRRGGHGFSLGHKQGHTP
jgi:hypothetical protein